MMARGGGKNGLISGICSFLLTPMYWIKNYNISIVANSEDIKAKTSFHEIYSIIERTRNWRSCFYPTSLKSLNKQTRVLLNTVTSNRNTKDGLRDGAVIFDEIRSTKVTKMFELHLSGLGRLRTREFYIERMVTSEALLIRWRKARNVYLVRLDGTHCSLYL